MSKESIKVLLVDDEQLIRGGLKILLNEFERLEIVGEVKNGREALAFCDQHRVDIVLMDIRMPEVNGIEGTELIKKKHPNIKVLILTTFQDVEYISQSMQVGASGYLLKDSSPEEIYAGIQIALSDNVVLDGKISQAMLANTTAQANTAFSPAAFDLSDKEIEIIRYIASGLNNQEIAGNMFLSVGTIKNNISMILSKLELRDRTQLAIFAFQKGLMN
ncbi:response regulator transcription factor [Fundicoccus culcitae]|uniref:Response regulator transcription factor n=1 Tax=Fundicoccus culcitae TaxID=2969821 RepID=A0ABY5P8P8_9LACT|nr:response regulator transcription factor [Fundicoccus culcitae]UUX34738.1 response regulator transcription factor [Fundicoccus culcitae]